VQRRIRTGGGSVKRIFTSGGNLQPDSGPRGRDPVKAGADGGGKASDLSWNCGSGHDFAPCL